MKSCAKCGGDIMENVAFCPHCGVRADASDAQSDAPKFCRKCGSEFPVDAGFCSKCGAPRFVVAGFVADAAVPVTIKDHLVWSIVTTILFFPLGAGALVFTLLARHAAGAGEREKAADHAKIAFIWNVVMLVIACGGFLFWLFFALLAGVATVLA